jgi:hypothetical protein
MLAFFNPFRWFNCVDEMIKRNHYKGYISCDSLVPSLKEMSSVLSPQRTPNILVRAFENDLEVGTMLVLCFSSQMLTLSS